MTESTGEETCGAENGGTEDGTDVAEDLEPCKRMTSEKDVGEGRCDEKEEEEDEMDSDNDSDLIPPSSCGTFGKTKLFTADETDQLFHLLKDIIITPPINDKRITNVLNKSGASGKLFLRRFKMESLINKAKYGKQLLKKGKSTF